MPSYTTKQNIIILRNGLPRKRNKTATEEEEPTDGPVLIRDHYERYALFMSRQYPRRKNELFVPEETANAAGQADRDTPLGIIDTIVREFICHWLAEAESFLADDAYEDAEEEKEEYKKLATYLADNTIVVSGQVDCTRDARAATLRDTLQKRAYAYLFQLFNACQEVLDDDEKVEYDPQRKGTRASRKNSTKTQGVLSEARILNSALAWELVQEPTTPEIPRQPSPRKRRLSQMRFLDDIEAADNGQVWRDASEFDLKQLQKHKFDFEIINTIKVSGMTEYRYGHRTSENKGADTVDLTGDDQDNPGQNGDVRTKEDVSESRFVDTCEFRFRVPGAFD